MPENTSFQEKVPQAGVDGLMDPDGERAIRMNRLAYHFVILFGKDGEKMEQSIRRFHTVGFHGHASFQPNIQRCLLRRCLV